MPDRTSFIRAIRDADRRAKRWHAPLVPIDTDGPRLVFADWLEERGDPQGEFIRLQVELDKPPTYEEINHNGEGRLIHHPSLRQRERKLLSINAGSWVDGLPESLTTKTCEACADGAPDPETNVVECRRCDCTGTVFSLDSITFRRGLVDEIDISWEAWAGFDELVATGPGDSTWTTPRPGNWKAILESQPVSKVNLTTRPSSRWADQNADRLNITGTEQWSEVLGQVKEWEGVEFTLPSRPTLHFPSGVVTQEFRASEDIHPGRFVAITSADSVAECRRGQMPFGVSVSAPDSRWGWLAARANRQVEVVTGGEVLVQAGQHLDVGEYVSSGDGGVAVRERDGSRRCAIAMEDANPGDMVRVMIALQAESANLRRNTTSRLSGGYAEGVPHSPTF